MDTTAHTCQLGTISIEGVSVDEAKDIESEVRTVLHAYLTNYTPLKGTLHINILITDQMERHVDRVQQEYGRDAGPYQRVKQAVIAAAITLSAKGGPPFHTTLVFDIDPWREQAGPCKLLRLYLLGHELGHALQLADGTCTQWETWEDRTPKHSLKMRALAAIAIDEWNADITAIDMCRRFLRDDKHQVVRASEIQGPAMIQSMSDLCDLLCEVVGDVNYYRNTNLDLEKLYPSSFDLLSELLVLLTHTMAIYASDENMDALLLELSRNPGFQTYVEPYRRLFVEGLVSEDRLDGEEQLVEAIANMLLAMGIEVEDQDDGSYYVHVSEPLMPQNDTKSGSNDSEEPA